MRVTLGSTKRRDRESRRRDALDGSLKRSEARCDAVAEEQSSANSSLLVQRRQRELVTSPELSSLIVGDSEPAEMSDRVLHRSDPSGMKNGSSSGSNDVSPSARSTSMSPEQMPSKSATASLR